MKYLLGNRFKVYPGHGVNYRDNYDAIDWGDAGPTSTHPPRLTRNAVLCLNCDEEIESKHRHDFVTCICGNVSVDGGLVYLKRSGDSYEELSEYDRSN